MFCNCKKLSRLRLSYDIKLIAKVQISLHSRNATLCTCFLHNYSLTFLKHIIWSYISGSQHQNIELRAYNYSNNKCPNILDIKLFLLSNVKLWKSILIPKSCSERFGLYINVIVLMVMVYTSLKYVG